MRSLPRFVVLAAGLLAAVGCGMQPGAQSAKVAGGLAVIDLDYVAKTIGRTEEISDALKVRKNALDQALAQVQAQAKDKLQQEQQAAGEQPTDEQKQKLAAFERKLNSELLQIARKAQADLETYRATLLTQFRTEVRPLAQQVAAEKGLGVVIPKNEGFLLSVDPGVDITAEVIKAYQTRKPAPAAAAKATAAAPAAAKPATAANPPAAERQ